MWSYDDKSMEFIASCISSSLSKTNNLQERIRVAGNKLVFYQSFDIPFAVDIENQFLGGKASKDHLFIPQTLERKESWYLHNFFCTHRRKHISVYCNFFSSGGFRDRSPLQVPSEAPVYVQRVQYISSVPYDVASEIHLNFEPGFQEWEQEE